MQMAGGCGTRWAAPAPWRRRCRSWPSSSAAELRPGEEVAGLALESGAVKGVRTADGAVEPFEAVVSNMDAIRTYQRAGRRRGGRHYDRKGYEPACSGVVLYLGLSRRHPEPRPSRLRLLARSEEEFDCIYKRGEPAPDPTCYLAAPPGTDPSVRRRAARRSTCSCTRPTCGRTMTGARMFPAYRQVILDKLKRTAGLDDIEERIVVERHLTPQDIHERYKVLNGAIYGLASHGTFMGAFKPGNRSRHVKGSTSPAAPPIPGPAADGADVRLDRGRRAGPGRQRHHAAESLVSTGECLAPRDRRRRSARPWRGGSWRPGSSASSGAT